MSRESSKSIFASYSVYPLIMHAVVQAVCEQTGISSPMNREEAEAVARLLKAVADPARLQLLSALSASPDGMACVCELTEAIGLSQPTVSHHLKILTSAGLLRREQRGSWAWYGIAEEGVEALRRALGHSLPRATFA
jgi:ArsR family transcriptional regulator